MAQNRFGLPRHIPDQIKRQVRQHCGFGCAICGVTITEYEHFSPDFVDADCHSADGIVLLCPNHHAMVTKAIIPKAEVAAAYANPAAKTNGFSSTNHPWFRGIPSLKMGGGPLVSGTPIPIQVAGENIIHFEPPEEGSDVCQISAKVRDSSGLNFFEIFKNEWRVPGGEWDFKCIANRYIFNDQLGNPMLSLRMEPPNFIAIELLKTSVRGIPIHITEDNLLIGSNSFSGGVVSNCGIGLSIG